MGLLNIVEAMLIKKATLNMIEYGVTSFRLHVRATIKLSIDNPSEVSIDNKKNAKPVFKRALVNCLSSSTNRGRRSGR